MDKLMYRTYYRDAKRWRLSAAFVLEQDALWYCKDKINSDPDSELEWKIMQGNRNIKVFD